MCFFTLDDVKYAAVKGGCSVAMLTHFSNMRKFPKDQVNHGQSRQFYVEVIGEVDYYWMSQIPTDCCDKVIPQDLDLDSDSDSDSFLFY